MTEFITKLPTHVLGLIVGELNHDDALRRQKDLYQCALVNHAFHDVATPLLWKSCTIRFDRAAALFLERLENSNFQFGQHVQRLKLQSCNFWNDATLIRLLEKTKSTLKALTISYASRITDVSITRIGRLCKQFELLDLTESLVTHRSMVSLGQLEHLRALRLSRCHRLTYLTLAPLVSCPLVSLVVNVGGFIGMDQGLHAQKVISDLTQLRGLEGVEIHNVSTYFIQQLAEQTPWPNLSRFTLSGIGIAEDEHDNEMVDRTLTRFIQAHPGLSTLGLVDIGLTDHLLESIESSSLTSLDVSYHSWVSVFGVRAIIQQCPNLVFLNLEFCDVYFVDLPEIHQGYMARCSGPRVAWLDKDAILAVRNGGNGANNNDDVDNSDLI